MQQLATLYKIDGETVFYKLGILPEITDATECVDVFNNILTTKDARYNKSIMQGLTVPRNVVEKIYRNIILAPVIISIVRKELIEKESPAEYLAKLSTAIGLVQVGMFADAAAAILSLVPDDILTEEQLTRWADLLTTADAVKD